MIQTIKIGGREIAAEISKADADILAKCEAEFQEKRSALLLAGDFERYLLSFGSHERFAAFRKIHRKLTDADFWRLLGDVWTAAEVIEPDKRVWLSLFQSTRPQRELLMTDTERATLAALPQTLEIWRGCGHADGWRGMSWTLDKVKATWFANEYAGGGRRQLLARDFVGTEPHFFKAHCQKADVIAYFNERDESEIVINPSRLKIINP